MKLSSESFFHWKDPRIIIDLRPIRAFRKGSFRKAVSLPMENFTTVTELMVELRKKEKCPIHLLDLDGSLAESISKEMDIYYLGGGYKSFQSWRDKIFSSGPPLILLGGKTGSGKTEVIQTLKMMGHQILDLEALAMHKGSVFGNLANNLQPSHECFHNSLLEQWISFDADHPVWVEEKSHVLGSVGIPQTLYTKMSNSSVIELEVSFEERLQHIHNEYASADTKAFVSAIQALEQRMGRSANHKAIHYHSSGQIKKCLELLLLYYDQAYEIRRERYQKGTVQSVNRSVFQNAQEVRRLELVG